MASLRCRPVNAMLGCQTQSLSMCHLRAYVYQNWPRNLTLSHVTRILWTDVRASREIRRGVFFQPQCNPYTLDKLHLCTHLHFKVAPFSYCYFSSLAFLINVSCHVTRISLFKMAQCYDVHVIIKHFDLTLTPPPDLLHDLLGLRRNIPTNNPDTFFLPNVGWCVFVVFFNHNVVHTH